MQRYLQSLLKIRDEFELNGEVEVSSLVTSAVELLSNSSEISFDSLIDINEKQILTQLNQLNDDQKLKMLEAYVLEKDLLIAKLLKFTPSTIRQLAVARAMEQVFNRVDL